MFKLNEENIVCLCGPTFLFISKCASSISANLNIIPMLNGTNFTKWKDHIKIVLEFMDIDYALRTDEPLLLMIKVQ